MKQPMLSPPFLRFMSNQQPQVPMSQGTPVLANPMQPTAAAPVLQGATGNRRMSVRMPQMPNNQIHMGSEGLMRIGGAGLSANNQGALATLGAMANQYGNIQDYNRAAKMEEYNQQVLRANEEAERRRLALKMQQDAAKENEADPEALGELRVGMAKLQQAKDALMNTENLTGLSPADLWNRVVGRTVGNKQEAIRLFLNEIRLDSILRQVSKTKGAISNAEMALFGSQAPDVNAQETVWLDWINRQMTMQQILMDRLATGKRVDENAPISETMPTIANTMSTTTTTPTITVDPEIEAIVNQYTNQVDLIWICNA